ncbi:alginate O-acetyltransferase AlgI [Prevotella sp. CAG:1031]|nr:alginate O-acetyltransferase AlgI [Prevotella sp. CAG:1031]
MQYDISTFFDNVGRMLAYEADHPMLFSSGLFWVLFLIFLPVYALLRSRRLQMVVYVVAFSLYFYYKSSAWFFMLLIITSVLDWCLSRIMSDTRKLWKRRLCLWLSIGMSLSILGFFKYANFFLWNWNQMVEGNFQPLDIILPVGISFYTFQSISYIVDVYKGRVSPTETWIEYLFFLSYFPALVAGPIVRADYFLPQIQNRDHASRQEMAAGLWLIILGLVKKAVVADYIAQYNDLIFASPTGYSGLESLMGVVGYVVQIYCDFSGYSDMAIGISAIMGFRLTRNFDFPYKSRNLTDFWRRWHISLSTWLRDYVYIPLGGNRRGTLRTYVNNFLTMLVGGLWHGAAWKFIIWGGMHGVGLIVHKALRPWLVKIPDTWPVKAASWTLTMAYVSFLFIFFRAASFEDAWLIIRNIFGNFDIAYLAPFVRVRYVWLIFVAMIIAVHSLPTRWINAAGDWFVRAPFGAKLAVFIVAVQLVVQFMSEDVMPFIYFQF